MTNNTLAYYRLYCQQLEVLYPKSEAQAMARMIFEKVIKMPMHMILLNINLHLSDEQKVLMDQYLLQLKLQKPIQYILGEAFFFDRYFKVTPDVLIPRPETEELVRWILQSMDDSPKKVIDLGTGSGCIAISLACNRKNWKIIAADISEKALQVAIDNAKMNDALIEYIKLDLLNVNNSLFDLPFDIIVSNPPYVKENEKIKMHSNVLDNEPNNALFVPDDNPLVFYKAIAIFATKNLNVKGSIFCEINESHGAETKDLFTEYGFRNVILAKDIHGKDRMIWARKE